MLPFGRLEGMSKNPGLIRELIRTALERSGSDGVWQFELEHSIGFTKSYISDTLKRMENAGEIIRSREGEKVLRIWLTKYFPHPIPGTVRVWMLRASEYIPALYSIFKTFREMGNEIIVYVGSSGQEISRALTAGYCDIGFLPTLTTMINCYSTSRIKIIAGVAFGGSSVLEKENSSIIKVATTNASSMYALASLTFGEGTNPFEVYEDPGRALKEFMEGKEKFIVTWEPYLSRAMRVEGVKEVASYEDVLDSIPCCIMCSNVDYYRRNGKTIDRATKLYKEMDENSLEDVFAQDFTTELLIPYEGFSASEMHDSLHSIKLFKGDLLQSVLALREKLYVPIADATLKECFR